MNIRKMTPFSADYIDQLLNRPDCAGQSAARFPVFSSFPSVVSGAILSMLLAVNSAWAGPVVLSRQSISLPASTGLPLFFDVDGDGRRDLLAIDPFEKRLAIYRHRPGGFTHSPEQVIPLPPQTAWAAVFDVEAHPGLELLMSTARGLFYSRQDSGRFELEKRTLIEANQVFTNAGFPILASLAANKGRTNEGIPVIFADRAVLYRRNSAYEWSPGPSIPLAVKTAKWQVGHEDNEWTMGANRPRSLRVRRSFQTQPDPKRDREPENEAIRKILDDMKKTASSSPPMTSGVDVDGDGLEDLVLWQVSGRLDIKTDIYVFLRGKGRQLPERPSQILHCAGTPIPVGSENQWTPVGDLNGDGVCELVLMEPKTPFMTPSGMVEMAISRGMDWLLAIRSFHRGGFSRSADASVPATVILVLEALQSWPLCIQGDFNGDGRPDLLVRRSQTQWNIFHSAPDGRWFDPQPALSLDAPAHGYMEIDDLDGDGLADIVWHEPDASRLSIYLSAEGRAKGTKP